MRIDAYNQISQIYRTAKAGKTAKARAYQQAGAAGGYDELQISQTGRDYQAAKQAVGKASDIREDKVARLKEQVADGSYKVDAGDFAAKLLEKYEMR